MDIPIILMLMFGSLITGFLWRIIFAGLMTAVDSYEHVNNFIMGCLVFILSSGFAFMIMGMIGLIDIARLNYICLLLVLPISAVMVNAMFLTLTLINFKQWNHSHI